MLKSPSLAPQVNFWFNVSEGGVRKTIQVAENWTKANHWIGEFELVIRLGLITSQRDDSGVANGWKLCFPFSGKDRSISSPAALELNLFSFLFFFLTLWRGQYIPKIRGQLRKILPLYWISLSTCCLRGMGKAINRQEPREGLAHKREGCWEQLS